MEKEYKCNQCNFKSENHNLLANHVRWTHSSPEKKAIFHKKQSESTQKRNLLKYGNKLRRIIVATKTCTCGTQFETKQRIYVISGKPASWNNKKNSSYEKEYCCRSCSNKVGASIKRVWTDEMKAKQSCKAKEKWEDPAYSKKVLKATRKQFSSKREREIIAYIKKKYPEDGWTFGTIAKYKDEIINPDLWSKKLKIIFEYDGIWHFKDIHDQLQKKQKKDKLTEEFAIDNEFRLIRVDEDSKV